MFLHTIHHNKVACGIQGYPLFQDIDGVRDFGVLSILGVNLYLKAVSA